MLYSGNIFAERKQHAAFFFPFGCFFFPLSGIFGRLYIHHCNSNLVKVTLTHSVQHGQNSFSNTDGPEIHERSFSREFPADCKAEAIVRADLPILQKFWTNGAINRLSKRRAFGFVGKLMLYVFIRVKNKFTKIIKVSHIRKNKCWSQDLTAAGGL